MPRDIELCESIRFVEQHPRLCPRDFKTFIRTVVMLVEIIVRTERKVNKVTDSSPGRSCPWWPGMSFRRISNSFNQ